MRHFFRMKKYEWKVKTMIYGAIISMSEQQRGIMELLQKLYTAFKDMPEEELKREFIEKLAGIIHDDNQTHE